MEDNEKNKTNGETSTMKYLKRNANDNDEDNIDVKRKRIFQPKIETDQQIIKTNFCNLPDELLVSIFHYLDTIDLMDLCLTCERFFDICYEKSLWKIINIRDINLTEDIFKQYMNFAGAHTEEFHIIGTNSLKRILTFDNLYQIKIKCPNLRALHLENQMLESGYMFVSLFPSTLKELSLANCSLLNDTYFQRFFAGIDSYFTNLETLILTNCLWFSSHSIMAISKLPKLKFLYLDGCIQLNNFMPYLSLSTRYGFKNLELVDLRRTYVSDSEVSCFNASKTLKALYLEHVCVESKNNRNKRAVLKEENSIELPKEFFITALIRLSKMITDMEQHLGNMDTPKSRILKINFNTLMQDLSKCITRQNFYRLFCTLEYLQKLVNLEANFNNDNDNTDTSSSTLVIKSTLNKNDFKIQKRIQSSEKFDNSGIDSFDVDTTKLLSSSSTSSSSFRCQDLNKFIQSINPQPSCSTPPATIGDACRIICINVTKMYDNSLEEDVDEYLHNLFIKELKQITRRVYAGTNEHTDVDSEANFYDNTVLVGLEAATNVSSIDDRTVHALFNPRSECIHLERVSFRGCQNITNKGLIYLMNATHTISFLDVRGTGVTPGGCIKFQSLRPCCELKCDFEI